MNWPLIIMWVALVILALFSFCLNQEISKIYSVIAAIWQDLDRLAAKITDLEPTKTTNKKTNKVKEKK